MVDILTILRWSLSLGVKFFRVVPFLTLAIVALTLVSQISLILSFFLPLKIIILLGSEGMPRYFPDTFAQVDRNVLISWLSGATVGIFLLSLCTNKLIDRATSVAACKLLHKSQKMVLFENQDEVAAQGYQRYSSALASVVFIFLALAGLSWFYPSMSCLIAGYMVAGFSIMLVLYQRYQAFREYLDQKLAATLALVANVGFFVVFAYLVIEFIFFSPPGFIIAIVSILISRQAFGRAAALVNAIVGLAKQRARLDALFFHGKVLISEQLKKSKQNIWHYIDPGVRSKWISDVLVEAGVEGWKSDQLKVNWLNSSQPNIPCLLLSNPESRPQKYLLKIFNTNCKSLAQHEATLATEKPEGLVMPNLVLMTQVGNFICHLYSLPMGSALRAKEANLKIPDLKASFFSLKLPTGLVNRYLRSKPLVADRLAPELLERLYVASRNREDTLRVAELLDRLPVIKQHLQSLPLVLVNPSIKSSVWKSREDQSLLILNWSRWSLEPLGADWPVSEKSLRLLAVKLTEVSQESRSLQLVVMEKAQLAALAYELERLISRQQFIPALRVLPRMLDKLNSLE